MATEKEKQILQNFLDEMENLNKSHHTIVNYRSDIIHFLENCANGIDKINIETLQTHLRGLNSKSPTTKARHISSLKTFLNWCYKKDYIHDNPIYKIEEKRPKIYQLPKNIDRSAIERVICSINIFNKNNTVNLNNLKYRLLFTLMLEAGLKVSEALNLRIEDIETETETLLINSEAKRRIPLYSSESIKLLRLYSAEIGIKSGLIFKGGETAAKSLSYQAVNRFWRKTCQKAGANLTLQQLRDYYARELLRRGFNIDIVSKLLGHKNIQTTAKYLQ